MAKMIDNVLKTYLRAYRGLIAVEPVDENSGFSKISAITS